jgi:hypothetical protein
MRQRGRKSAASVDLPNVNGDPPRLDPPSSLTNDERSLFVEITEASGPRHFVGSDLPLLVSYVQATLLSRQAIKDVAKEAAALALWEKAVRVQAMLATRLRLSPQARTDPKTIGRLPQRTGPPPWER